jgi:HSP20 family protein
MSFFPRALVGSDPATSFTPLFRLLDDFDNYSRGNNGHHLHRGHLKSFNPRFDVKEVSEGYELHGELPGVDQKDVEIEFTDPQTITIRGRTERSYTSGTPPAALEASKTAGAITEGTENGSHKATVEDEDATAQTSTEVTTTSASAPPEEQKEQDKFWVSERSVGEFHRSFSFPSRVDQDAVKASMKNGILSILVPKAKKHESKKIVIGS